MPYGWPGSIPGSPYGGFVDTYQDGLMKESLILDYLRNGLFPCNSDITMSFRSKKKKWEGNDHFDYRMLMANTNTGGSANQQMYSPSGSIYRPGKVEYGLFRTSYGYLSDSLYIDMTANLETADSRASFNSEFSARMQSLRYNTSSIFKNYAIHGGFGVILQFENKMQLTTRDGVVHDISGAGWTPSLPASTSRQDKLDASWTMLVPNHVYQTNFKAGRTCIKTQIGADGENSPWHMAYASFGIEILDNQPGCPGVLTCCLCYGSTPRPIVAGEYLEIADNRTMVGGNRQVFNAQGAIVGSINPDDQYIGINDVLGSKWGKAGAPEGLADLFPWYTSTVTPGKRLGMDLPFRGHDDRLTYQVEQSGQFHYQAANESIMDAILAGVMATQAANNRLDNVGVWMNPMTRQCIEYEEGEHAGIRATRQLASSSPVVFQKGVTSTTYHIGSRDIKDVLDDANLPTDVVIIGPQSNISWNCWDNAYMDIDKFITGTFGPAGPKSLQEVKNAITDEFRTSLSIKDRVVLGPPQLMDGVDTGRFIHPQNVMAMFMYEMGALYTETPHYYTVVKLKETHYTPMDVTPIP